MNDFVTRGTKSVTIQKYETQTDPRNGGVTTLTGVVHGGAPGQSGFSLPSDAYNYLLQLRSYGWQVQVTNTQRGNQWTFTATYNADLILDPNDVWIPEPIWEVETNEVEKNILECTDRPFIANLSSQTKACIELAVKNAVPNPQLIPDSGSIAQLPNAHVAYALKVNGVEGFGRFTKTVKRTLVASNRYNPVWMDIYDNKILSKSVLVATYNMPAVKAVLLPPSDTAIQTDTNGITTFWGYRQYPVNAVSVPPNKTQYSQYWVYNKWSVGATGGYDVIG